MTYNFFEHPLADGTKTVEVDGKPLETINSWTFAAMILDTICDPMAIFERADGLENAQKMAVDAIKKANPDINYEKLMARCKEGNTAAKMQAQSLVASGVEILMEEQFSNPSDDTSKFKLI